MRSTHLSQTLTAPAPFRAREHGEPDDFWHIHVEVVGGPMDGLSCRSPRSTYHIGRGRDNDLCLLLDPMVSTAHARILREEQHYWLEDLNSRNGVYLGDRPIQKRVLIGPGTTFLLGQTQLEFMPR